MIAGNCERRRFCASTPRKFVVSGSRPMADATAAIVLPAVSRLRTGLFTSPLKSADSASAALSAARLAATVRSEEHTSELQSLMRISYAVFCLKKKNKQTTTKLHKQTT